MHPLVKLFLWMVIAAAVCTGLLVAAVVVFMNIVWWSSEGTGSDGGSGSQFLRARYHDGPRYFEVTAKLEVAGKPVEITRVMACEPYFQHRFGVGYFMKQWYLRSDAMTQRLPDGSGVIVVIPKICNDFARPQPEPAPAWGAFPDFPENFVPLIFWTEEADNPEVLEGYISFESLQRPGSRVRFESISLRNDPNLQPAVSPHEFGVMTTANYAGYHAGHRPLTRLNYVGSYLLSVAEEHWRQVPEVAAALDRQPESRFLEYALQGALQRDLNLRGSVLQYALRGGMELRTRGYLPRGQAHAVNAVCDIYGLEKAEDGWIAQTAPEGVVLYYLLDPDRAREASETVQLESAGIVWHKGQSGDLYYESSSRRIVDLERTYLSFHPLPE